MINPLRIIVIGNKHPVKKPPGKNPKRNIPGVIYAKNIFFLCAKSIFSGRLISSTTPDICHMVLGTFFINININYDYQN